MKRLKPVQEKFVLHWGEMGAAWGLNKTVAQIHALLYLSEQPLHAQEICELLELARSNVSTSIKELLSWRVIKVVHVLGDRRDHFECIEDVWEMFRIIMEERKHREIDPTLKILSDCMQEAKSSGKEGAIIVERLSALAEVFGTASSFFDRMRRLPLTVIRQVLKLDRSLRDLNRLVREGK